MDAATVALCLVDIWPNGVPAADYPRLISLIQRFGLNGSAGTVSRYPNPTPPPAGPRPTRKLSRYTAPPAPKKARGRPPGSKNRKPGRPARALAANEHQPLRVLVSEVLSQHPEGLTGADIAKELGAPGPSVYSALREVGERKDGVFVLATPSAVQIPPLAGSGAE